MHIASAEQLAGRTVGDFGSEGFRIAGLGVMRPGRAAVVSLAPGGRIGRHPAVGSQCLLPLLGRACVTGRSGEPSVVGPGEIVVWEAGEDHETRSVDGLTALMLEGVWERGPL